MAVSKGAGVVIVAEDPKNIRLPKPAEAGE